jgi:hypothetical protein
MINKFDFSDAYTNKGSYYTPKHLEHSEEINKRD